MDAGERPLQVEFDEPQSAGQEVCPECGESVAAEDIYCPHCGDLLTAPGAPGSGFERMPERIGAAARLQAWLIGIGALTAMVVMLVYFAVRAVLAGG